MSEGTAVEAWMRRHGRGTLVVVSPHLDDAVYSAFTILSRPIPCEVVTVVSSGLVGVQTTWSTLTGFPDSATEHRVRCAEDEAVLGALGVASRHLGAIAHDRAGIVDRIGRLIDEEAARIGQIAWLLPAGAGHVEHRAMRLARRLLRRPFRDSAHPEHVQVRDAFVENLSRQRSAVWGFYAELPYAWQEPIEKLPRRLILPAGAREIVATEWPPAAAKEESAAGYRSQAAFALGPDLKARTAFCSRPEWFVLG